MIESLLFPYRHRITSQSARRKKKKSMGIEYNVAAGDRGIMISLIDRKFFLNDLGQARWFGIGRTKLASFALK